ncbi:leucine-rich repeat protein [Hujiaoplasma nucleasis]|uniref:Leucine-rich repeat protein n=1 Tax=Hujiaoplasma nucleasis TaxID=2725268 RepID=A0A7L6N0M7_9MOLU|nr:leucine-rich repeat protein [Hujiaoplasma nucleasis]QLY39806.1 leucine-rich repeat protein [Hujiaoplasma nucleasis]
MKFKILFVILFMFFLNGCQKEETTDLGVFILEYPHETVKIEGQIGENVIIPEAVKDDYIFIGWTDGSEYYAGLTEIKNSSLTLTPAYIAIEDVFEKVVVSLGQVSLVGYKGDSKIVGVPVYWRGYMIAGFSALDSKIEKLFLPSGIQNTDYHLYLTDFKVYDSPLTLIRDEVMDGISFAKKIAGCTYKDGSTFDINDPQPGYFNDACVIKQLIRRDDDSAITVPGKGILYAYDVIRNFDPAYTDYNLYSSTLRYLSFAYAPVQLFVNHPILTGKNDLEVFHLNDFQKDDYTVMDNQIVIGSDDEQFLSFVYSDDDLLTIDASRYDLWDEYTYIYGHLKEIDVKNSDDFFTIDGILYYRFNNNSGSVSDSNTFIRLVAYPNGKTQTSFTLPENVTLIHQGVYNTYVESVTLNETFSNLNQLLLVFPNMSHIHLDGTHDIFIEEDGVIYDKDKTMIFFVNQSVERLVIEENISLSRLVNRDLPHLHIGKDVDETFFREIHYAPDLYEITIEDDNPYMYIEDGVVYSKTSSSVLYILDSYQDIYIKDGYDNYRPFDGLPNVLAYKNNIKSIHLNAQFTSDDIHVTLGRLHHLESISIDPDNPYFITDNQILYSKNMEGLSYIPPLADIINFHVNEELTKGLNSLCNVSSLQSITVDANNPLYQAVDGVLYNKDLSELICVPEDYQSNTLLLPETMTKPLNRYQFNTQNIITDIYLPQEYPILYEYIDDIDGISYLHADDFILYTRYLNHISIHEDSPYYDQNNALLTTLDGKVLLGFIGQEGAYEIPDSIEEINPYLFHASLPITDLTLSSSLQTLPEEIFSIESLETLTIRGDHIIDVGTFDEENYAYYFNSIGLIIYVDDSVLSQYQDHPFWSFYEIRVIE